jgi:multiple sugar transport system ATP-binding protein
MGAIVVDRVTKDFSGGVRAIDSVSLTVPDGEFMVLVGPSGCGKSTLLRMIAGLEEVSAGTISIGGRDVTDLAPRHRDIAMVFQNYALYPHMDVRRNLGYGLRVRKTPSADIDRRVNEVARLLGLEELLDRKPAALSGGQRQRVAMGRAIVREPQAFLMDEPLSNLDAKLRVQMRADIARLQDDLETTTIYVTHDQVEAMTMGDRVAVMSMGELQQVDIPQRLYDAPANMFVAGFIGTPPMNLIQAQVQSQNGSVALTVGPQSLMLSDATLSRYPGIRNATGKSIVLGMRSDDLYPAANRPDLPTLTASLELLEALGSETVAHLKVDAEVMRVHGAHSDEEPEEEQGEGVTATRPNLVAKFSAREAMGMKLHDDVPIAVDVANVHVFDAESGAPLR